jgi:hypothetical protein
VSEESRRLEDLDEVGMYMTQLRLELDTAATHPNPRVRRMFWTLMTEAVVASRRAQADGMPDVRDPIDVIHKLVYAYDQHGSAHEGRDGWVASLRMPLSVIHDARQIIETNERRAPHGPAAD